MNNVEIADKLFDASLRIDRITWIAGATEGFADSDFFEEVILEASDAKYMHESMAIFKDLPDWAQDAEGFAGWATENGIAGFVVQVQTPKPVKFHEDGGFSSYGFGLAATTVIYVENIADAVPLAIAWQDQKMEEWRNAALDDPLDS